ncbi:MAG: MarR family transcriptional regulator [Phenylobacterium sp. RIFCSPHIGHO2_01_FULL_69_31]|uniref:MarR family winged helix-turn-helix transcriptional regulator n=1 Tax=Phenylobacterium sp. RIFCSPHIGHO2_01_FULL_69_31 TaxID=1801944 RepID=UPI0008D87780|nr:MarR family transcriptional regulator [Phenylobacterium sp. RIFCSPHIGHO2_01_FULL_69_31]OHB31575.1 MAG: MarR family transcriptional regulator [Phenylobacterium sp. RIFCSPHIGHO2_01_FULL_69_31]
MNDTKFYADPTNSIGYLTRIAFRAFSRALEVRTAPHGVSSGQWRFLRVLWREDGLTQRELSRRVGMREPTTVIALKSLERSGFVTRQKSLEDRRKVHVFLTPEARALEAVLLPAVAEVNAVALAGLTPDEVAVLRKALTQVGRNLTADVGEDIPSDSAA